MEKKSSANSSDVVDYSMNFEHLLMQVLGNDGYQTASCIGSQILFKKYINKIIDKMENRIDDIEMDVRLKEMLFLEFSELKKKVAALRKNADRTEIFIESMKIITRLLGYDWCDGTTSRTPVYTQTLSASTRDKSNKTGENYYDRLRSVQKNLFGKRIEIIRKLKADHFTTPEIAFIFKTSDYEIKKKLKGA